MRAIVLALLSVPGLAFAQDHLEPRGGMFVEPFIPEYFSGLRTTLLSKSEIRPSDAAFEVYVAPSFEREWRLAVALPAEGGCAKTELSTLDSQYWSALNDKSVDTVKSQITTACLPPDVALAAKAAVERMISQTRIPSEPGPGLDGVSYYFVGFHGTTEGTAWSPKKNTRTATLVQLIEAIRSRVEAPKQAALHEATVKSKAAVIMAARKHGG
jgi:hypothetical protein